MCSQRGHRCAGDAHYSGATQGMEERSRTAPSVGRSQTRGSRRWCDIVLCEPAVPLAPSKHAESDVQQVDDREKITVPLLFPQLVADATTVGAWCFVTPKPTVAALRAPPPPPPPNNKFSLLYAHVSSSHSSHAQPFARAHRSSSTRGRLPLRTRIRSSSVWFACVHYRMATPAINCDNSFNFVRKSGRSAYYKIICIIQYRMMLTIQKI